MTQITNFHQLLDELINEKYNYMSSLVDNLDDMDDFSLGRYQGRIHCYEEIIDLINDITENLNFGLKSDKYVDKENVSRETKEEGYGFGQSVCS